MTHPARGVLAALPAQVGQRGLGYPVGREGVGVHYGSGGALVDLLDGPDQAVPGVVHHHVEPLWRIISCANESGSRTVAITRSPATSAASVSARPMPRPAPVNFQQSLGPGLAAHVRAEVAVHGGG